jgi:SAM-dependent methyltransferase
MTGTLLQVNKCPLCNRTGAIYAAASDIEYFTTPEVFKYYRCDPCDVLYIHPAPIDRLSTIYPANYYSFVSEGEKNLVVRFKEWMDKRAFRKFLKAIPGDSLNVLDIGGGSGWLAGLLRDIDPRIKTTQIVDIDAGAQSLAERNGHKFFCGKIEDFASVDRHHAILMLNLIEHVADPVAVLRKASESLAPGGRIYVKTPNFRALDASLFKDRNWGGYHCPRHFVLFSRQSFSSVAAKAGLAIDEFSYTQGAPFWSVSILEMLRRWSLVSVSAERPAIYHPIMPFLQAAAAAFDFARAPFARLSQMIVILTKLS